MKKKIKHEEDKEQEVFSEPSETTGTEPINALGEKSGTDKVAEVKKVDKCTLSFPNEDLNKLVEKINELIDKIND